MGRLGLRFRKPGVERGKKKGKAVPLEGPRCLWLGNGLRPVGNPCPDVVPVLNLSFLYPPKGRLVGSWLSGDI